VFYLRNQRFSYASLQFLVDPQMLYNHTTVFYDNLYWSTGSRMGHWISSLRL
jgi:hypothetical protein